MNVSTYCDFVNILRGFIRTVPSTSSSKQHGFKSYYKSQSSHMNLCPRLYIVAVSRDVSAPLSVAGLGLCIRTSLILVWLDFGFYSSSSRAQLAFSAAAPALGFGSCSQLLFTDPAGCEGELLSPCSRSATITQPRCWVRRGWDVILFSNCGPPDILSDFLNCFILPRIP